MLSRTFELFVPNAEASARLATYCVIVCLLTCSPARLCRRVVGCVGHACAVRSGFAPRSAPSARHVGAEEAGVRLDLIGGSY